MHEKHQKWYEDDRLIVVAVPPQEFKLNIFSFCILEDRKKTDIKILRGTLIQEKKK